MSIHLSNSSIHECSTTSVKCFAVQMERAETLAEFVSRVRQERRLSLNDVVRQSGNQIANSHVSRIENGLTTNVTTEKLRALAKGLGVSEEEIFTVARGGKLITSDDLADDEQVAALFYDYKDLTDEDKQELRAIWEMFREEIRRRKLKPKKKR